MSFTSIRRGSSLSTRERSGIEPLATGLLLPPEGLATLSVASSRSVLVGLAALPLMPLTTGVMLKGDVTAVVTM